MLIWMDVNILQNFDVTFTRLSNNELIFKITLLSSRGVLHN